MGDIFYEMLSTMKINKERMREDAATGFINATDLADYLVTKGMAFRDAYKISGEIVSYCIKKKNKRDGDNYCNKRDTHVDGCNRQSQCRGELCEPAVPTSLTLENLPLEVYKKFSKLFDKDVYKFIDLETCVNRRTSLGGSSPKNIDRQIKYLKGRE